MLRLGVDKYLPQILFFFFMALCFIWLNLEIEETVHHREENKKILESLQSVHTEMTCKLTTLNSVCLVEDMLQEMGSKVCIPQKQAVAVEPYNKKAE